MTELTKEIHRRALELMYYIAANTHTNDEYESALSQVAIDLLDEAVAFDEASTGPEPWDENVSEFDPFEDSDENIWWGSSIGEIDEEDDELSWLSDWDDDMDDEENAPDGDDFFGRSSIEDDLEDDTEYRQQADGRVL